MKINCIIVEDEPLAIEKLSDFINEYEALHLVKSFTKPLEAIAFLQEQNVDLIFLDIQMKGLNGIQFMKSLSHKPHIIITSAYDKYALECYEHNVSDYLLKPYSFDRFVKSVNKVIEAINEKQKAHDTKNKEAIFVHTEYRLERIVLKDILYIEGMKDYLKIVTHEKKIMTLQSFKNILNMLPNDNFIRVHKSYIVALNNIENIERNRIKIAEELIPVSDTYKTELLNTIEMMNRG